MSHLGGFSKECIRFRGIRRSTRSRTTGIVGLGTERSRINSHTLTPKTHYGRRMCEDIGFPDGGGRSAEKQEVEVEVEAKKKEIRSQIFLFFKLPTHFPVNPCARE